MSDTDLYSPVLQDTGTPARIYSETALFCTALIGGAIAAILFSMLNSRHLERLRLDWWRYVLAVLASAAVLPVLVGSATAEPPPAWMDAFPDKGDMVQLVEWGGHAFGIVAAIFLWAPLASVYGHVSGSGNDLDPKRAAAGCILAGAAIEYLIMGYSSAALYWGLM